MPLQHEMVDTRDLADADLTHLSMIKNQGQVTNFIYDSWLKSFQDRSRTNPTYFVNQRAMIDKLMAKSYVLFSVDKTDSTHLYGYIVYEIDVPARTIIVHWLYTKRTFRRMGIGMSLVDFLVKTFPDYTAIYTHYPPFYSRFQNRATYNPYVLMGVPP